MNQFTYCVLQYTDDPSRGEHLNCGVLVWMPVDGRATIKLGADIVRLSRAFPRFVSSDHTAFEIELFGAVTKFQESFNSSKSRLLMACYYSAKIVGKWLIPDQGMAYRFDDPGAGISEKNIEEIADDLFGRFVEVAR